MLDSWPVRQHEGSRDIYGWIGREIATRRLDSGLSQAELADLIGLTRTSISNIEKGRQKMLVHTLVQIAESLHTPVSTLLPNNKPDATRDFSGSPVSEPERDQITAIIQRLQSPQESEE